MDLLLRLTFRNLLRAPKRTLAILLAFVVGLTGVILHLAFIHRSNEGLSTASIYLAHMGHISVLRKGAVDGFFGQPKKFGLTPNDVNVIRQALQEFGDQVEDVQPILIGGGLLANDTIQLPFFAIAGDPTRISQNFLHPMVKRWAGPWAPENFPMERWIQQKDPISIPEILAKNLKSELGTPLQALALDYHGGLNGLELHANFRHRTGNSFTEEISAIVHLDTLQKLFQTDLIYYESVFLKNRDDTPKIARRLGQTLDASHPGRFEILKYNDAIWSPYSVGTLNFVFFTGFFVGGLILLAVSLSLVNIMVLALMERQKEMGTMMSLGFQRSYLIRLFCFEALIISLLGCAISFVVSPLLQIFINWIRIPFTPPGTTRPVPFMISINWNWSSGVMFLFCLFAVLLTAIVAWKSSKKKPIELLS